jgi:hexosaminidase
LTPSHSNLNAQLLPAPQSIQALEQPWQPPASIGIRASGIHARQISSDTPGISWVDRALAGIGCRLSFRSGIQAGLLIREESNLPDEGYRLRIARNGVVLGAASSAGIQHGLATLAQWLELAQATEDPTAIPGVLIEDHPTFSERGAMLDVARDKRPKLKVLKEFVEQLARWKYNRLQLYMEADFAYPGAELVLENRSPYTAREIQDLVQHAERFHVTIVPNQQSFGHMHPWLRHDPWSSLAEVPDGVDHPFSKDKEPFSLNPSDPKSLKFIAQLYDDLLPNFRADQVNVGLDETFDLGLGASRERCEQEGKSKVYVEFLNDVHGLLAARKQRMMYWGDIVLETPEILGDLPTDATAMIWGYEANHPFEDQLAKINASGLPFQVCPGTSSWNCFGGRTKNAFENLREASRCGKNAGAEGLLICDWGDRGHLQPWPISFFGWAYGAACAWNSDAAEQLSPTMVGDLLNRWAFPESAVQVGTALMNLGQTGEWMEDPCENGTSLFFGLVFPDEPLPSGRIGQFSAAVLDRVEASLERALELPASENSTPAADVAPSNEDLIHRELSFARDALLLGTRFLRDRLHSAPDKNWRSLPEDVQAAHVSAQERLRETHTDLWSERYRPGGLQASLEWLNSLVTKAN